MAAAVLGVTLVLLVGCTGEGGGSPPAGASPAGRADQAGGAPQAQPLADAPRHGGGRANVLLVSLDTLRPDHLGTYGYGRKTSPAIDALAASGAVFERAYTSFPSTAAAHMTLFTSRLPCVHGVTGIPPEASLPPSIATLPERFRAAGYATAAYTENAWVTESLGFRRGFETWVENKSPDLLTPVGQARETFTSALRWIESHVAEPWFVFVHTYQVHHPYAPPPGYVERVAGAVGEGRIERDKSLYDAEIRYTDEIFGELIAGLEAIGEKADTLIVVFSDHGEHFGEHGQFRHGFSLHEELLRVALVFHGEGRVRPSRIKAEVGLIDVGPTLLDLVGLEPLPGAQGRSLTPLLRGEELPPTTLFAELPPLALVAARREGKKYVIDTKREEALAFDLATDPAEQRGRRMKADAPEAADVLAEFARRCGSAEGPAKTAVPGAPLDENVREKLRALGYVD